MKLQKLLVPINSPIALGGYDSDNFDIDCGIQNLIIFDGKDMPDEIIIS